MPINSSNLSFNNSFGSSVKGSFNIPTLPGFIPVRVKEVNIKPNEDEKSTFKNINEYWGIGGIKFESLNQNGPINEFPAGSIALPLNNNIRTLPLVNEIVFVILGPSRKRILDGDAHAQIFYYTNSIPIWNSTEQNAYPSSITIGDTSTNSNSISDIENGIPNNPNNPKNGPKLGEVFEDQGKVKNLYPQEGDVIFEGRFGNSLRFSSTGRYSGSFDNFNVSPQNPWSSNGNTGDPLTILRNGQEEGIKLDNWEPIFENINNDNSSIYLTSTQNIPLEIAYPNLSSYGIDVTPPDDTTAQFQKTAETTGNEFTSNKEADNIEKPYDSVNVEPNLND